KVYFSKLDFLIGTALQENLVGVLCGVELDFLNGYLLVKLLRAQSGYYVSLLDRHIGMKVKLLEGSSRHCKSNVGVVRGGIGRVKHYLLQNSSLVGIGCVIVDRIPLADGYVDINAYIAVLAARGKKRKTQHQHRQKYRNALHNVPP